MTKHIILLTSILFLFFTNAHGQDLISGKYSTDYQEMTLSKNGNHVTGNYGHDNGKIEGDLNGNVLKGWWFEDGNQKGKFIFTFSSDFSSFTGLWGSNDADPTGKWDGSRISLANGNNNVELDCLELKKKIYTLKSAIEENSVTYNKLFADVENFDKSTRLNFCTKDVDHYTQYGTLEFDDSWSNYFSNLNSHIGLLGKIPVLSPAVDKIGKLISVMTTGMDAMESQQLPVDEAIAEYNKMRKTRTEVIDNLITLLNKYYCNNIFDYDRQLYELYNNIIPNNSNCDVHEKSLMIQEISRNRPAGLPAAIWTKSAFESVKNKCQ